MILKKIKVDSYELGDETNCYIIADEETKEAMVIDPGGEPEKIQEMIEILGVKIKYIYLTHCHGDHIGGVVKIKNNYNAKVLIHRKESENLNNPDVNLTKYIGMESIELEADSRVDDDDLIHIGNIEFKVIHTPGHTAGCSCLYSEKYKMLFSGDTLFRGTWGRTDLPTGSMIDIMNSITDKLMTLPEDTIVYPGHGKSTMIREEKPIYLELRERDF